MTTVKQMCLGVAVAGVVAGAGAAVGTAVAYAEPTGSDSTSGVDAGPSASSGSSTKDAENPSGKPVRGVSDGSPTTSDRDQPRETRRAINARATADADAEPADAPESIRRETAFRTTAPAEPLREATRDATADRPAVNAVPDVVARALGTPAPSPSRIPLPAPFVPAAFANSASTAASTRTRNTPAGVTGARVIDPTREHVLVIGVDGTNLSRILSNPQNQNFLRLMETSTTASSSIVGHTTISNPSWTAILTGAWDNKTAVINNVFTPETYYRWPTVYTQLEGYNPAIRTKAIADWDVITDIAGAGAIPADDIVFVPQIPGDTDWAQTDAAVTAEAVKSILGTDPGYEDVPNFLFTYLVQVDENGHMHGGASDEYAASIGRTDANLGLLLDAVAAREAASGEDWTIIVVTDHGHQPQLGFGHGFQSPDETETFIIADGPDFADGAINLSYEIVDVAPTVVSLFGSIPDGNIDGVPLMSLNGGTLIPPNLYQALEEAIASNRSPDPITTFVLSLRTIFATIPYYVVDLTGSEDNPLYEATNVIAQIVAQLTGVQVFPPQRATPRQPQNTTLAV
ncbi:alkaline phosphatase family protein [Mycolicibacterium sp. S2-37]|uniref:alkaline phosphatase family protein n=1 Tax=Mycolicibacterium sp. S2-37 TaxID=2810297 RepID=UPI001A93E8E7|nr:alkaline phosphatase family protein [Mycolicibacterium sp. S2-37]MBO0678316.1 alkaline phosphatase family protein [Mycolicibacterium sp. S2-37]